MQKKLTLAVVVILIVAAIVVLENPEWLQTMLGGVSSEPAETQVVFGVLENPAGDDVGLRPGNAAPDFALKTLDGGIMRLSDFRGEQFVIVNLWASWCGPCKVEMPDLEKVYTEFDDLVVLGVDLQESVADIQAFLDEEVSVSYPILLDADGKVASTYNMFAQPTSFLIDKQGIIRARKNGAYTPEELDQAVEALRGIEPSTSNIDSASNLLQASASANETIQAVQTTSAATPPEEPPTGVVTGFLNEKYFGPGEINSLGLSVDLQNVPYRADLELDKLVMGCPVMDCIASIDKPRFERASDVDWLSDQDKVLAVRVGNTERVYPISILNWHEIVNDNIETTAVVVSYCPLCNSALVFEAPVLENKPAQFGVSARLYYSDLIMYDRTTASMWSQIEGAVLVGPLTGRVPSLKLLAASVVPWPVWVNGNPNAEVLARPTTGDWLGGKPPRHTDPQQVRFSRDYAVDPYALYHDNPYDLRFPVNVEDRRLENKTTVVGVEVSDVFKAYPLDVLKSRQVINDVVNGIAIVLVLDSNTQRWGVFQRASQTPLTLDNGRLSDGTQRWTLDGNGVGGAHNLTTITSLQAYWFAWAKFHPDTEVFAH